MHYHRLLSYLSIALLSATPLSAQGKGRKFFGQGNPFTTEELPNGELKAKLKKLKPQARAEALKRLHSFSFPESDAAKFLKLDEEGGVFIVCPINGCDCDDPDHDHGNTDSETDNAPDAPIENSGGSGENIPIGDGTNETFNPTAAVPVSTPPAFNSKPGAPFHIYLDFNGAYVTGKQWTYTDGTTTWSTWDCAAWSTDGDATTFSISEQNDIRRMWERIAEDYAPFNVNVTTDAAYDPDTYTGDKNKVGWLLTTPTTDKNGIRCPHYGYGGVAYVNVFGRTDYFSRLQPAWVTPMGTANTAEAASHEMGHNLGLSHDGLTTGAAYYGGHVATTTAPSWGPIMGTGYSRNVSQWSKSTEYFNGNQAQDDLPIIAGKLTYRTDDHGDTFPTATPWTQVPVNQSGVVETTNNTDVFTFSTGAGTVTFNASTYRCDTQTWGGNLDIALELYNSSQTLVASNNPAAEINASISASVPAGTYYLVLKPSAAGTPLAATPSGYTAYGSLGFYNITGNFNPVGSIFLSAPNGGETWFVSSSQEITWSSGLGGNVKIELFKNGSLNSTISTNTPNDGSFFWSIPAGQQGGSDYKIKITSIASPAIFAESFANFSIGADPLVTALDFSGYTWTTSGNQPWFFQTTTTNDGVDAAQSGAIDHDQSSSVQTTIVGPGTMTYFWKVSSESGYDFLRFFVNDVEQTGSLARISGNVEWVQKIVTIPTGSHTVRWSYTKDGSVVAGSDAAWVDQVTFTPDSLPGSLAITPASGLTSSGTFGGTFSPSSLQFTLSNPGGSPINWTAAKAQSWVTLSSTSGTLAAGANTTVTATINGSALNVGNYSDTVTFANTTNGTGNTTRPISLTVNSAPATVTLGNLTQTFNGSPKPVSVTTSPAGLANSVTYNGSGTAPTNAGTYAVVATVTAPNYTGSASGSLTVNKASQSITFAALSPVLDNAAPFALTATASSGLAVSYTSSNTSVATVSGNTITIVAAGSTTITASQAGNANFNAATSVPQTLTVTPSNAAPTFTNDPIVLADATENTDYTGHTLAGQATDPNPGDTLTYAKVSGPTWLTIAANGTISGTPPTGSAGLNSFTVSVSDGIAAPVQASLLINVNSAPVGSVVFTDNFEPGPNSFGGTTPNVTTYTLANTSQQANTNLWVRATSGFGSNRNGLVDESENGGANFSDPTGTQAYGFRYTNSGVTTAVGKIGALTAGTTIDVSFDVVVDGFNAGNAYHALLVLFDTGAARNAVEFANKGTAAVLAQISGTVANNGSYNTFTFSYVVGENVVDNNGATAGGSTQFLPALLGTDIALRFAGKSSAANIDNVQVSISQPSTNSAPVWTNAPINEIDANEDSFYTASLTDDASDADSDSLTFAKVSGPAWLNVSANGDLSGTPTQADVGSNSFTVSVSDGIDAPVEATLNITVINVNDAPVVNAGSDQTIFLVGDPFTPGWSFVPWTGDADADISTEHTYTVAHNFGDNRAGSVTVNGVTFTENFNATGPGWSIGGAKTNWQGNDVNNITGASEDLAEEFIYNGKPRTVTLSGLTVGQNYEVNFYSAAWETGNRIHTFSTAGVSNAVINQDQYNNNNGIRITCAYTATATTQVFTITPQAAGTFHLYAMTNRVVENSSVLTNLGGTVSDQDNDPLTTMWTMISGPGTVVFEDASQINTTATFGTAGTYVLRLTVDDTITQSYADVTITVDASTPTNIAPVFLTNPIIAAPATEGIAYTGVTLAGQASDPSEGDAITFSKVSGPAWLAVASDGTLSGTPPAGSTGLNSFIVSATNSASASADATLEIIVTGLPLPWVSTDIGTGMLTGSTAFNAGTFTLAGSGLIGGTGDQQHFTYQTLTGDGEIIARISDLQNTGTSSRVGVMIRDSLAANSQEIFMGMTGSNAYRWSRRTAINGSTATTNSSTGTVPNTWVRLVRSGTTITAYKSTNGTTWTTVGSTTNTTFAASCYIGIAVGSGSTTTLNTSQFSNVSVTP